MGRIRQVALCVAAMLCALVSAASAEEIVRVGVLKFGTVNWELDAMQRHGIDRKHGIAVEIVPFAGEQATTTALQGGSVDMIVSDWLFVSRQRAEGGSYVFAPYSSSVGAIMVPRDSPLHTLADLKGRTLGVAGGPLDKNFLLIQALARRDAGFDLAADARIVYGAPPLLAEKARQGELDAVLIFWNHAARLEAEGFRRLISGEDAAKAAGASGPIAAIGYVFDESWAAAHPQAAQGFVAASRETKQLLKTSDAEWQALQPLVQAEDEKVLAVMRDRYREGIPSRPIADEVKDAALLWDVLETLAGEKLVGPGKSLDPGAYWAGLRQGA